MDLIHTQRNEESLNVGDVILERLHFKVVVDHSAGHLQLLVLGEKLPTFEKRAVADQTCTVVNIDQLYSDHEMFLLGKDTVYYSWTETRRRASDYCTKLERFYKATLMLAKNLYKKEVKS